MKTNTGESTVWGMNWTELGEACLPFAEQKVVSGVVFSSDAPVLFQNSFIMDGSRNEGPELLLSCQVTQTAA